MFSSNTSQVSSSAANYVEDVFSTYLYTGTGASQTITNNIDTTTYGGLVWVKGRSGATGHRFTDTARGTTKSLTSNNTAAQGTESTGLTAFGTSGFTIGADVDYNNNAATYASWSFRKQAKFFDVVTYTGNGANRTIAHNLGSVPGCIIVKRTDTTGAWQVYHRSLANTEYLELNTTAAKATGATRWNSTTPTSTEFSLGTDATVNANSGTYVAYLFAHDAGGFGLTGSDNVISCGSVSVASGASNAVVNLGYEPQWVLWRNADVTDNWYIFDNMRGIGAFNTAQQLNPNLSDAESAIGSATYPINITSTGFSFNAGNFGWGASSNKFIYVAIRRGPMKTPTSGTSVFTPVTYTGNNASTRTISGAGFAPDLGLGIGRSGGMAGQNTWYDRLRGKEKGLISSSTGSEYDASTGGEGTMTMSGMVVDYIYGRLNDGTTPYIMYFAQRAPSVMDVVCYTGTDNDIALSHNLGVAPEAIILKKRSGAGDWAYETNFTSTQHTYFTLNSTIAGSTANYSSGINLAAQPTSTTVTVAGGAYSVSGSTYVMYMFASCPGVSKVGSYTGTGTTKQIDCGFTGGARFVLIKRTDSTGDWYVWDSARGIVSGNDPYLLLNSAAAEVTNTDYIDTYSAGFEISSTAPAAINANGGSFIFLAVA